MREALLATYGTDINETIVSGAVSSLLVGAAFAASRALHAGTISERKFKAAMGDVGVGFGAALAHEVILQ